MINFNLEDYPLEEFESRSRYDVPESYVARLRLELTVTSLDLSAELYFKRDSLHRSIIPY